MIKIYKSWSTKSAEDLKFRLNWNVEDSVVQFERLNFKDKRFDSVWFSSIWFDPISCVSLWCSSIRFHPVSTGSMIYIKDRHFIRINAFDRIFKTDNLKLLDLLYNTHSNPA